MTYTPTKRYMIEATDEYGSLDYEAHETEAAAIEVAKTLGSLNKVRVVDLQEMLIVWQPAALDPRDFAGYSRAK